MASDIPRETQVADEDGQRFVRATSTEIAEWTCPRSLSRETQERIRDLHRREEKGLNALDQEIFRTLRRGTQSIAPLLQRRQEYVAYIKVMQGAMSPMSRIPPEILSRIFAHYAQGGTIIPPRPKTNPWKVGQVSSYWRQVLWSTPEVWKEIVVSSLPEIFTGTPAQYAFAIENLFRIRTAIEDIFSRSGATQSVVVHNHLTTPVADLIIPLSNQIKSLSLMWLSFAAYLSLLELPPGSWDCLETLTLQLDITDDIHSPLQYSSFHAAPNLKDVHIELMMQSLIIGKFHNFSLLLLPWLQLNRVTISRLSIPCGAAHTILAQCTAMSYCSIVVRSDHNTIITSTIITLTQLETFEASQDWPLDWSIFLQPFVFPALKRMVLMPGPDEKMCSDQMISLEGITLLVLRSNCRLETLSVGGDPRNVISLATIADFDVESFLHSSPELRTLIGSFILPPSVFDSIQTNVLDLPFLEYVVLRLRRQGLRRFLDFLDDHITYHPERQAYIYSGNIKKAVIWCRPRPRTMPVYKRYERRSRLYRRAGLEILIDIEYRNHMEESDEDGDSDSDDSDDSDRNRGGGGGNDNDNDDKNNGEFEDVEDDPDKRDPFNSV